MARRTFRVSGDGTASTFKQIGELLPSLLKRISNRVDEGSDQVLMEWPAIVGERIARMTQAVRLDSGILEVRVSNSTLCGLLVDYEKKRLLGVLQKKFPKVNMRDICFRVG